MESEKSTPDKVLASRKTEPQPAALSGTRATSAAETSNTRRKIRSFLIAIFLVTLFDFVYELSSGWVGGAGAISAASSAVYFTGALTTLSFFLYRVLDYQTKFENANFVQRLSISFFDLITYFCIIFLAVWGLIFPLLRPIPPDFQLYLLYQRGLALNLYVGLIVCASIIICRAAVQPLIGRLNAPRVPVPQQEILLKIPSPAASPESRPFDTLTYEMLTSINKEIARMREQINVLSTKSELALAQRPLMMNPSAENSPPPRGAARVRTPPNTERPSIVKPQVDLAPPTANPEKVPSIEPTIDNSVYQIPDSARDNPWASILSGRRHKPNSSQQASPAPSGEIAPLSPLANPSSKTSAASPNPEKSGN